MSGPEERQRAVELYSATPRPTAQVVRPRWYGLGGTAQVVEHLGYPTRQ
ncbi:hypothetical protein [Bifidobacterium pseudocatenulatum]|nr:hypothetical protein [Bifidobacteriaceae bacterium]